MAGERVTVERYALPLSRPLETADATLETRTGFLVRVDPAETETGGDHATGVGEAAPLPPFTESQSACERALEEAASVAEEAGLEAAHDDLDDATTPAAAHGLTTATLDAAATAVGQPLYRLLGGDRRDRIPVNAVVGDASTAVTADAAAAAVDAGFECVKVKVGARTPDDDVDRLAAVRDAVGPAVTLRADANGAWSRDEAERALDGLSDADLQYVEQPLPPGDLEGLASLRTGTVPVAIDEGLSVTGVDEVVATGAADAVIVKPMAHGSPASARAAAMTAIEAGLTVTVTTTIDAVVARTAAVHVAASLPTVVACGLATADRLAADLGPDPAPVADGSITVPQAPGLGIEEVSV